MKGTLHILKIFFYSLEDWEYTAQKRVVPSARGKSAFKPGYFYLFYSYVELVAGV